MIIGREDLASVRRENWDKRIVLLKGTFDLLHQGHVNRMRAAKALGDMLVVFVKCDEAIKKKGPDRPIEDENQRAAVVDAIRWVDYTVIADKKQNVDVRDVPEEDREQVLRYYRMIADLKPDVLIKPEKALPPALENLYHELGTEIHVVEETPGISTTMLINKIRGERKEKSMIKTAIGQDSHRYAAEGTDKPLILAGVEFPGEDALEANSDGDVVLHAVTRAISGITTVEVLGPKTKVFLAEGITDSRVYLEEGLKDLHGTVVHLSVSMECSRPKITPRIPEMRRSLAALLHTDEKNIGITASSGEGLTEAGKGNGISAFAVLTVECASAGG